MRPKTRISVRVMARITCRSDQGSGMTWHLDSIILAEAPTLVLVRPCSLFSCSMLFHQCRWTGLAEPSDPAVGDKRMLLKAFQPFSRPVEKTDLKPKRKTILIAVWVSLLLFTLFSGSIAG